MLTRRHKTAPVDDPDQGFCMDGLMPLKILFAVKWGPRWLHLTHLQTPVLQGKPWRDEKATAVYGSKHDPHLETLLDTSRDGGRWKVRDRPRWQ